MKIVIFGASGIIGSTMRLNVPAGVEPIWMRREPDPLHRRLDLLRTLDLVNFLKDERPVVIINLAGESRPDVVERDPDEYFDLNVIVPAKLAHWCERNNAHYVHISTQAVFSGEHPPYHPKSQRHAVNEYGKQKLLAEERVERVGSRWTIVRPTFVLGVRPVPTMGRENPVEQMLTAPVQRQVSDRWFSVSFARDVAAELWKIALGEPLMKAIHIGIPHGVSRYDLAATVAHLPGVTVGVNMANHADFEGIAPRPIDTTFANAAGYCTHENAKITGEIRPDHVPYLQAAHTSARLMNAGLSQCQADLAARNAISVEQRAKELSLFTGLSEVACLEKLNTGFHALHAAVAADFNNAVDKQICHHPPLCSCGTCGNDRGVSNPVLYSGYAGQRRAPQSDKELLEWYRSTDSYCWELSAYHCDVGVPAPGWNYSGMCAGIIDRIHSAFPSLIESENKLSVQGHEALREAWKNALESGKQIVLEPGLKVTGPRVLCLGDGIGDLTLAMARRGINAVYHDLLGSKTAAFANLRYWMYTGKQMPFDLSVDWNPSFGTGTYDAIVSLDFFEHCVRLPVWLSAVYAALKPGGLLCAQNAFNIGSGSEGSIPCHLTENDRYEKEWDDLCATTGFRQISSNWYEKPKE